MTLPSTSRVHAQVILSRVLVATSFTVGSAITFGLAPEVLTFVRFGVATLLFAPYVHWRHRIVFPGIRALLGYSAISASIVTFFWCMFEALRHTSAVNAAAIHTLVPGLSALYAFLLVRERLPRWQIPALLLGLVGAVWVVFRGDPNRLLAMALGHGDLIFFLGCLAMGLYTPLIRYFHRSEPAAVMSFWVLATGTFWLALLNNTALWHIEWTAVPAEVYAGIVYLAVFTTILTFFIQQHATVHIGPTRVATYNYLTPMIVVIVDWMFGNALPDVTTLTGVVIILGATVVVQRGSARG